MNWFLLDWSHRGNQIGRQIHEQTAWGTRGRGRQYSLHCRSVDKLWNCSPLMQAKIEQSLTPFINIVFTIKQSIRVISLFGWKSIHFVFDLIYFLNYFRFNSGVFHACLCSFKIQRCRIHQKCCSKVTWSRRYTLLDYWDTILTWCVHQIYWPSHSFCFRWTPISVVQVWGMSVCVRASPTPQCLRKTMT